MKLLIDATVVALNTGVLPLITSETDAHRIAAEGHVGLRVDHAALQTLLGLSSEHIVQVHVPVPRLQPNVTAYLRGAGVTIASRPWSELRGRVDYAVAAMPGLDDTAIRLPALGLGGWEVPSD